MFIRFFIKEMILTRAMNRHGDFQTKNKTPTPPPPQKKKKPHTHKQKRIVQPFSHGLVIRSLESDNASVSTMRFNIVPSIQTICSPGMKQLTIRENILLKSTVGKPVIGPNCTIPYIKSRQHIFDVKFSLICLISSTLA